MGNALKLILHSLQILLGIAVFGWAWLALAQHASGAALIAGRAFIAALVLLGLWLLWQGQSRALWLVIALVLAGEVLWWVNTPPRGDRDWAFDVAHGVTGDVDGDQLILRNVRNFDWTSVDQAVERWEERRYDLSALERVDLITSVWDFKAIAHTLISFGFADGEQIVFSGEIRREKGEVFSAIGGFFKKYELVMIAADEHDIVKLRIDQRGEQVALYPLDIPKDLQRKLLLSFVDEANALDATPAWYHTILSNCTTVPYRLVKTALPQVAFDWRIIFSGYVANYLQDLGVLRPDLSREELHSRAAIPAPSPQSEGIDYSRDLRRKWAEAESK